MVNPSNGCGNISGHSSRRRARCLSRSLSAACCAARTAPAASSCLQELRRAIRADAQPVPRIGNAARLFFMPVEPFLIDGRADHKRIGRIARVSLEPIWAWLGRDLMPAEAKALSEDINRALLADDRPQSRSTGQRAARPRRPAHARGDRHDRWRRKSAPPVSRSSRHPAGARRPQYARLRILALREMLADLGAAVAKPYPRPSNATRSIR